MARDRTAPARKRLCTLGLDPLPPPPPLPHTLALAHCRIFRGVYFLARAPRPPPLPTSLAPPQIQKERKESYERIRSIEDYLHEARVAVDEADHTAGQREEAKLGLPVLEPLLDLVDSKQFATHGLLAPDQFLEAPRPQQPRPRAESVLHHTTHTESSYEKVVPLGGPTLSNVRNEKFTMTRQKTLGKLTKTTKNSTSRRPHDKRNERGVSALRMDRQDGHTYSSGRPASPAVLHAAPAFKSEPAEVLFDEYKAGETRSTVVRLINESASSQSVRILPPAATNFTISSVMFPGQDASATSNVGRIAPGLVCEVTIAFLADTLADYGGELAIVPEHGEAMSVRLLARRPAPALGLPATIDCGPCQLKQTTELSLPVCNTGAPGRFRFVRKADAPDPAAVATLGGDFWDGAGPLEAGPFVLTPAAFSLNTLERAAVGVAFTGTTIQDFEEEVALVIDNGTIHGFTLAGQCEVPSIRLVGLAGGFKRVERKASDAYRAVFNDVYPADAATRSLTLANDSQMAIPYSWDVLMAAAAGNGGGGGGGPAPFSISPASGELAPESSCEFELTYETTAVGYSEGNLSLQVASVPGADETFLTLDLSGSCVQYDVAVTPAILPIPGELELGRTHSRDVQVVNNSDVAVQYSLSSVRTAVGSIVPQPATGMIAAHSQRRVQLVISPRTPGLIAETLLCTVQNGETLPLQVEAAVGSVQVKLDEPSVDLGLVLAGEHAETEITFRNCSGVPAAWEFVLNSLPGGGGPAAEDAADCVFTPSVGQLAPFGEQTVRIRYHTREAGNVHRTITCVVGGGPEQLLEMTAVVQVPQAHLQTPLVELGTLFRDTPVPTSTTLRNLTSLPTTFVVKADPALFTVTPSSGVLGPKEELALSVQFASHGLGKFSETFEVEVEGAAGGPLTQTVAGLIVGASVVYSAKRDDRVALPTATVPSNLLETFGFAAQGGDNDGAAAADTSGTGGPLALDFGDVRCSDTGALREFTIRNTSAIPVDMAFGVLGFPAAAAMHEAGNAVKQTVAEHGTAFLRHTTRSMAATATPATARPAPPRAKATLPSFMKSKTKRAPSPRASRARVTNISQDYSTVPFGIAEAARVERSAKQRASAALAADRGAAFEVRPPAATVAPFEEITVQVLCYSDTWGRYKDVLRCTSSLVPTNDIPLEANVLGSPVTFQVAGDTKETPIVRLGQVTTCHVDESEGTAPASSCTAAHTLRLKNPCPFDLVMRWECYLTSPGTPQLVDLLCYEDGDDAVKLHCRPHEGVRCDTPFGVDKASAGVMLGRARNLNGDAVKVHFKSPAAGEFLGLVRGVMTMKDPANLKVSRAVAGDAATAGIGVDRTEATDDSKELRFYMTASAVSPRVSLPLEVGSFHCDALDMLNHGEASATQFIVMSNTTTAQTALSLVTEAPFRIDAVEFGGVASPNGAGILLPGQSLKAEVSMSITNKMLMQLVVEDMHERVRERNISSAFKRLDSKGDGEVSVQELEQARVDSGSVKNALLRDQIKMHETHQMLGPDAGRLRVGEVLTATFLDGTAQTFDLFAEVPISILGLSTAEIDFGVCLAGATATRPLTVTNRGLAHTGFEAVSSHGAFGCVPSSGPLQGFSSHVVSNSMTINVE